MLVSFTEELICRGYILNNLMQSMNKWLALALSSLVFAAFHSANPDVSIMSIINIYIAGLLLGINYIYTRNLWFSIFFHFVWNVFQGPVLGYDVSGLHLPGMLQQTLNGPDLLTGGPFGFEGSLICPLLTLAAIGYFGYSFSKRYAQQPAHPS
jgi:hypothetical protein